MCVYLTSPDTWNKKKIVNLLTGSVTSGPRNGFKFSPAEACMYWSRMDAILAKVPYYIYRGGEIQECFVLFCFFFSYLKKFSYGFESCSDTYWVIAFNSNKNFQPELKFFSFYCFFFSLFSVVWGTIIELLLP